MKRVTGIGGIFFKSQDPEKLYGWYEKHLGIQRQPYVGHIFEWKEADTGAGGQTVWSLFPQTSKKFDSGFMLNYRVDNMDALLAALKQEGVEVERSEDSEYGKFAWLTDPDGNKVELWEPPKE